MSKAWVLLSVIFLAVGPAFAFHCSAVPGPDDNLTDDTARMEASVASITRRRAVVLNDLNGGKVVFSSDRVQPPQIFLQTVDVPGAPRQLTEEFFGARSPKWSRNGKYIVYITSTVITGPAGTEEVLIVMDDKVPNTVMTITAGAFSATGLGYPQWSDDGTAIVVMLTFSSGKRGVGIINFTAPYQFEHKTTTTFGPFPGIDPGEPVFSLDGQTIYFAADSAAGPSVLHSMPIGGGTPTPVNDDNGAPVRRFFAPSLSPDGTRLMYNSELWRDNPPPYPDKPYLDEEILELNLVTKQIKRITNEAGNQYGFFAKNGAGEFIVQSNNPASAQYALFLQQNTTRIPFDVADPQNLWKESPDWWKPPCGGGTVLWSADGEAVGCKFPEWGARQRSFCGPWQRLTSTGNVCEVCVAAAWVDPKTWTGLKEGTDFAKAQASDLSCLNQ